MAVDAHHRDCRTCAAGCGGNLPGSCDAEVQADTGAHRRPEPRDPGKPHRTPCGEGL